MLLQQAPTLVTIGTLAPCDWVRFENGDIGLIRDKVDQPGYRKASVEIAGARYPIRITPFDTLVEHLPSAP